MCHQRPAKLKQSAAPLHALALVGDHSLAVVPAKRRAKGVCKIMMNKNVKNSKNLLFKRIFVDKNVATRTERAALNEEPGYSNNHATYQLGDSQ